MDEAVLALLGTLVEIRGEPGENVYESAVERARVAVAAEVMVEAERRVLRERPCHQTEGNVVILRPGRSVRKDRSREPEGSGNQS